MAHADQFDFIGLIKKHFPASFQGGSVLEIGSLDINGSVRSFFEAANYTGVDVAAGPGVDEVCQGQLVGYPSGVFDVGISCECMEHNPFWVETVSNIFRMTKPGGLVIISCATTGRAEHGTTRTSGSDSPLSISIGWEYYRNVSISEFKRSFNLHYWCEDYLLLPNWHNCDLYFVGVKKPSTNAGLIAPLRKALSDRFRPTQSFRSMCVGTLATLFGEFGVSCLRAVWRLVPRTN
jgi:SAM-dependent methyltransferase